MSFVLQLKSKEEFDGCTGYEKVEKGNPDGGPFSISFDKVFAAAVLVVVVVLLVVVANVVIADVFIVVWELSFPFISRSLFSFQEGTYYFVCGVGTHCTDGPQKVESF